MADEAGNPYIDHGTILVAVKHLNQTGQQLDRDVAYYLESILGGQFSRGPFGDSFGQFPVFNLPQPTIAVLGIVVESLRGNKKATPQRGSDIGEMLDLARTWGLDFILEILIELRDIICGKGKTPKKLSDTSQSAISALTILVAHKLRISDPTAFGIAVLILLSISRASKNAFCRKTTPEELRKLLMW